MAAQLCEYTRRDVERLLGRWKDLRAAVAGRLVQDVTQERVDVSHVGSCVSETLLDLWTLEAAWVKLPSGPKRTLWWLYALDKPAEGLAEVTRCHERTIWKWRSEGVMLLEDVLNGRPISGEGE